MPRLSIDTNILIYAIDTDDRTKHEQAAELINRLAIDDTVLTQQVLGELLNVLRRRARGTAALPREAAGQFAALFTVVPTPVASLLPAFDRADRFEIQYWDALIITVCLANGVTHLLSEDMQDGQKFDGLTIINPFNSSNQPALDALLRKPGEA